MRGARGAAAALGLLLAPWWSLSQSTTPQEEILALLNAQVKAWNEGDLHEFMEGYWASPELTFFSGGSEIRGWQATLRRYIQRYQSENREMGRLRFLDLRPTLLGDGSAFVRGRWQLTLSHGEQPGGLFTLILRKLPGTGWRIVHDHTSS